MGKKVIKKEFSLGKLTGGMVQIPCPLNLELFLYQVNILVDNVEIRSWACVRSGLSPGNAGQ